MIELDTIANGPVPFWFWNGDQQENEITRQMELAAEGGVAGMAIHARKGNQTEYMSGRWIALTRHTCREARRLGLDIWLYDEEGFPSGTVGHRLQKNDPFYQQKHLRFAYVSASEASELDNLAAVYDAETFQQLKHQSLAGNEPVLIFQMRCVERYVDCLKRDTAERFLEMTHRNYFEELGDYFGDPITHIYTDDLNSNLGQGDSLPFTERLFEIFQERLGYDLKDNLPKLVENLPGFETVRLDFRKLVMDLFLNEFVEPMHTWCRDHGVLFTGHLCGDEGPFEKSIHRFGAAMPFYEYEDVPGIDDFLCSTPDGCYLERLKNHRGHSLPILVKQAASVGNQLKGGMCGGEVLTFLGWSAPVWGQAALLNVELALGINVFTHHDFSYATGGVAKRDCPPSYFFQQPYWHEYKALLDALARSSQLLKRGRYVADVLVLHPMSAGWIAMDGERISCNEPFEMQVGDSGYPHPRELEDMLAGMSNELLKLRIGFDYGDEWLMAKHAQVADGIIHVGDMGYKTVIIPKMHNLLRSTLDLLKRFEEVGGNIVAIDPPASCRVDGRVPDEPVFGSQVNPTVIRSAADLNTLDLTPDCALSVAAGVAVVCHTRIVDGQKEHYVLNASAEDQSISWNGPLVVYDPVGNQCIDAGGVLTLPSFHGVHLLNELPQGVSVVPRHETIFSSVTMLGAPHSDAALKPLLQEGMLLGHAGVSENYNESTFAPHASAASECGAPRTLPSESWRIILDEPNLLLIDWCDLPNGSRVYHTDKNGLNSDRLSVTIDVPDPGAVTGILGETVTLDTIRINGKPLPNATVQHPSSQDMMIADARRLFKVGTNLIEFDLLDCDVLFEPYYLMGDFGVELVETDHGMRPLLGVLKLGFGDLVENGLPFYWGSIRYETQLEIDEGLAWLNCGDVDGVLTLEVNGQRVGCRYMQPYRFYIGDKLCKGANTVVLRLHNTAQNLYGPHRSDFKPALVPCKQRGEGNGVYYLASFGINGTTVSGA